MGFRKKKNCTIEGKTAQLICAFVFVYAKSRVSHEASQLGFAPGDSDHTGHLFSTHPSQEGGGGEGGTLQMLMNGKTFDRSIIVGCLH